MLRILGPTGGHLRLTEPCAVDCHAADTYNDLVGARTLSPAVQAGADSREDEDAPASGASSPDFQGRFGTSALQQLHVVAERLAALFSGKCSLLPLTASAANSSLVLALKHEQEQGTFWVFLVPCDCLQHDGPLCI